MKTVRKQKRFTTFSLFCGLGGEHLGKQMAFRDVGIFDRCQFWALNHWQVAIDTLQRNFPHTLTYCEDITKIDVNDIGLDRIDLLWASPSCVHFSNARGGKPRDDQQRAHATEVYQRWLKKCDVPIFLMENVREFISWGPLDEYGKVIKSRKGEYFHKFVRKLEKLGYEVDWKILNAADYGDPTTRKRFFLQAVKDGKGIHWAEPTHRAQSKPGDLPIWKSAAKHVIDWSIPGKSIYYRNKPLATDTIRRIKHGLKKFGLRAYLVGYHDDTASRAMSTELPITTLGCSNTLSLICPYIMKGYGVGCTSPSSEIDLPLPTITQHDHNFLIEPTSYLIDLHGSSAKAGGGVDVDRPLPTISTTGKHNAVVKPFIVRNDYTFSGEQRVEDVHLPLTTMTQKRGHTLTQSYLIDYHGQSNTIGIDAPIPAQSTKDHTGIVNLIIQNERSIENLPIVRTPEDIDAHNFLRPFCIEMDGSRYVVDITLRMLEPKELARAMGFPETFCFEKPDGSPLTKQDAVKMIGNACPVNTVRELVKAVMRPRV